MSKTDADISYGSVGLHRPALSRAYADRQIGRSLMASPPTVTVQASAAYTGFISSPSHFQAFGGTVSGNVITLAIDSGLPATPISNMQAPRIRFKGATPAVAVSAAVTYAQQVVNLAYSAAPVPFVAEFCHYGRQVAIMMRSASFTTVLFRVDGKYVTYTPLSLGTDDAKRFVLLDFSTVIGGGVAGVSIANPGVVTTNSAHNLTTGDVVQIASVGGATQANGIFPVTVLSATTFSIPINVSGTYTSGGTVTGGYAARTIELIGSLLIEGIETGPLDTVWLAPRPRLPRWYAIGDSFFAGTGAASAFTGMMSQVADGLGCDDFINDALGGTGVIRVNGSLPNYVTRAANNLPLLGSAPDAFLVSGSVNDSIYTAAQVTAAGITLVDAFRAVNPLAPIVVACFASSNPPGGGQTNVRDGWVAVAAARTGVYVLDLSADLTGTGYQAVQTASGNQNVFRGADGTHPTQPGHDFYARRILQFLQASLPSLAA